MKKQNGIRAVLWTVLMLAAALTGCCADGENVCTLDPADPARFTCGGVEYITLREAVPRDAVGRKLGDIQTLAAVDGEGRVVDTCGVTLSFSALARLEERLPEGGRTVQVLNVWALPGTTDGSVAVMVDGTFRRAVPADVLPPEAEVLSFARQAGGYGEAFAVMPEDCRRLTCGETVYLVTDTPVAPEAQGAYLGVLARSCVFDADTGRELTRAELEHIEPVPGPLSAQRRESRVYGAVYALEGTDSGSAVAVEVDGALLRAEAERRAPGASWLCHPGGPLPHPCRRAGAKKGALNSRNGCGAPFLFFRGPISVQAQARCSPGRSAADAAAPCLRQHRSSDCPAG